jgi:hypothetical protein
MPSSVAVGPALRFSVYEVAAGREAPARRAGLAHAGSGTRNSTP